MFGRMNFKNIIKVYAVSKRLISEPKSQIDQKCKDGNRYSMQMETKRELAGVAIQISDKTVFK